MLYYILRGGLYAVGVLGVTDALVVRYNHGLSGLSVDFEAVFNALHM